MTFLNPLYLIALAAAAIPVILHLLNLRKSRTIEFSTLVFLKELQKSKIRKLKIRQWLLLILRTLIIIFVVLAFTRPAMRSAFGFLPGTTAKSSVVIILDNSYSMLASDDKGQLLKQAKDKASQILDMLSPGDEAVLLTTSQFHSSELEFTAALNAIRKEIQAVESSPVHAGYRDIFTAVSVLLDKSDNLNKEIYLITDDQKSQYGSEAETPQTAVFEGNAKLLVFPLGTRAPFNASVTNVEVKNALFESGKPVDISATITNGSERALTASAVSIFLNGERVMQKTADIAPGGSQTIEFSVVPKNPGLVDGFVELEADDIPEDNRRYFAFSIPERIRVLLGPSGSPECTLIKLALQPVQQPEAAGVFAIDEASAASLRSANFEQYDAVVLAGVNAAVSPSFAQRLAAYVRNGGGVMVFPDGSGDLSGFTSQLLPALELPAPAGTNGSLGAAKTYTSFGTVDYDHPLFKNVFVETRGNAKPSVESPHLYYMVKLRGGAQSHTVVSNVGGDGFLVEQHLGSGKALVYAVAPNFKWSDFPVKGIFVPLLNRSVFYLASTENKAGGGTAGESFEIQLPASGAAAAVYDLIAPSGANAKISPRTLASGTWFAVDQPVETGVYTIGAGGKAAWKFPVNLNPAESATERISNAERTGFFESLGIREHDVLDRSASIQQAVAQIRYGVELWKYFIMLALLCALAEMLIARDVKRRMTNLGTNV